MNTAVVVIGRNEARQLAACLRSCHGDSARVVYVDSASSDGSVPIAEAAGVPVLQLSDERDVLTAAAGRNAGFRWLSSQSDAPEFVQFVDGDCVLTEGWLSRAAAKLSSDPALAIVTGRLRERLASASVYPRLCDMEWDGPCGQVDECGGVFMVRAADFAAADGFREDVLAGEEPELCLRLRRAGRQIVRLADDMAWHDSQMDHFGQWWQRQVRGGWAYAQGVALHGQSHDRFRVRQVLSNWGWGLLLPLLTLVLLWPTRGWSLVLLLAYAMLTFRVAAGRLRRGDAPRHAWLYALFTALGKFANAWGQCRYFAYAIVRK